MAVTDLVFIDSAGYHTSDFPSWLTFVQGIFTSIYGTDIYLGSDSQDGQFAAALAQAFYDTQNVGASTYNSFSPVTAQGVGLSRVVKINGIRRQTASNSTVELVLVGQAFTVLDDAIAIDNLQQQWSIPNTTIPISGTITVTATAIAPGAIAAAANTITGIFTPTLGWQTVNNPAPATPGAPIQTDSQLRAQQTISTANPSLTVLEGTLGAVLNTAGVQTAVAYENPTDTTDGNGLPPHSFSIVASGGTDTDVASAIQVHKTPGTQTYGTTTVTVNDSHGMPIDINFFRPTNATISVQVTITPNASYISSNAALIQAAVSAFISNPTNVPIGGTIHYTQLFNIAYLSGAVAGTSYVINSIELKKNAGSFAAADIALDFNEIAVCATTNVTVIT